MKFIQKMWNKAKELFTVADDKARKLTKLAIKVTNAIKQVVDSPVDDFIAEVLKMAIHGTADDVVIDRAIVVLNKKLPVIISKLVIIDNLLQITDPYEKAKLIIEQIRFSSEDQKNQFYHLLATTIISQLSDGKLTFGECAVTAEMIYQEMKKNNEL
jgi:hypothetical protein